MSYLSTFELRQDEDDYGKIVIVNDDGAAAGTEKAFISVEGPLGFIKTMDLTTPDIDLSTADNELLVDIPLDSNGDWLIGQYTIKVQDTDNIYGTTRNFTYQFDFCPLLGAPALAFSVNCVCAKATVTDNTVYGEGASIARNMTIFPPTIPGEATPSSITTSAATYTLDLSYANVKYQVNLLVEVESNPISGVQINEKISYSKWFDVVCDYDLCGLITCVNRELNRLLNKAATKGSIKNLDPADFDLYETLMLKMFQHNIYIDCGDFDAAQEKYDEIKDLVDCDCGCSSASTTGPVAISSACAGEASETAISATTPVVATLVSGTWQLSLASTFTDKVDDLKLYNITSINGDITVSKSYSAVTDIETNDLSLPVNTWNIVDQDDFNTDFVPDDPGAYPGQFGYRLLPGGHIECFGQMRLDKTLATGSHVLLASVLASAYRPDNTTVWYPMMGPVGEAVGLVRLNSSGQLDIYTEVDWVAEGWSSSSYVSFSFIAPLDHPALV